MLKLLYYGNEPWLRKGFKNTLICIPKREKERKKRYGKVGICNNILVRLTSNGPRSIANIQIFFIFRVDLHVPITDAENMRG